MIRWKGRIAVVTGAAAGIGAAVAKMLVRSGLIVVALDKNQQLLERSRLAIKKKKHQERYHTIQCDVSNPEAVCETFNCIESDFHAIDVLVNNAPESCSGQLVCLKPADMQNMLYTSVLGAVYCTQRAFKSMSAREFDGHIVLINSILGHRVFSPILGMPPVLNIYPMSKHALTAMTEVLRQELRENCTRIKVTSISPGFVRDDFVPKNVKNLTLLKPKDVAKAVKYVIGTPPHVQVHELTIKALGEIV